MERTTSRVVVRWSAFYNYYSCQVSSKILDSGSLSRFWSVKDWLKSLKDFWLVSSSTSWTIDNSIGSLLPAYYPETPYPPNHIKTHPSSSLAFLIPFLMIVVVSQCSEYRLQTMTELLFHWDNKLLLSTLLYNTTPLQYKHITYVHHHLLTTRRYTQTIYLWVLRLCK